MKIAGFSQRVSCFSETVENLFLELIGRSWYFLMNLKICWLCQELFWIFRAGGSMLRLISHRVGHKLVVKSTKASIDVGLTRWSWSLSQSNIKSCIYHITQIFPIPARRSGVCCFTQTETKRTERALSLSTFTGLCITCKMSNVCNLV